MIFENETQRLKLQILGYEFPELSGKGAEYDYEANYLMLRGTYTNEEGETFVFTNSGILTYELTALCAEWKVLAAGLKSSFVSDFTEPVLFMEADAVEDGVFALKVSFVMDMDEADLEAEVIETRLDAQQLRALVDELEELIRRFPEKKND